MDARAMRTETEVIAAVASFSVSGLAAVTASATGVWVPVEPGEMFLGAAGGLVGGLAYVFNRRIKDPLSAMAATVLSVAWCAALAPVVTHGVQFFYPEFGAILADAVVILLVGGMLGAGGMEVYIAFLALMDAVRKILPEKIDDIIDRIIGGRK